MHSDPEIAALVEQLQLQAHPEGGWYRELHRSSLAVRRPDGARRCAFTQILFLLAAGGVSRWHRVRQAEESWQHLGGDPLDLWQMRPTGGQASVSSLTALARPGATSPQASPPNPVTVVPADWWQAACSCGGWSLVVCTVSPGFEFDDFELLAESSERIDLPAACARFL
jgi:predicted cupin superfamily sugar epimerase